MKLLLSVGLFLFVMSSCRVKSGGDSTVKGSGVGQGVEKHMSDEARNFRDRFVKMKNEKDVHKLLVEMEKNYPKYK